MTDRIFSFVLYLALAVLSLYQALWRTGPEAKFLRAGGVVGAIGLALFGIKWLAYETVPMWLRITAYALVIVGLVLLGVSRARGEHKLAGAAATANLKALAGASVEMTLSTLKRSNKNGEKIG